MISSFLWQIVWGLVINMNHYKAYNGYVGESEIYVDVYACDLGEAMDEAVSAFMEKAKNPYYESQVARNKQYGWSTDNIRRFMYEEDFYNPANIKIVLCYEGLHTCGGKKQ